MKKVKRIALVFAGVLAAMPCILSTGANAESVTAQLELSPTNERALPNTWYPINPKFGYITNGACRYRRYTYSVGSVTYYGGETEIRHYFSGNKLLWVSNELYDSSSNYLTKNSYSSVEPYGLEISTTNGHPLSNIFIHKGEIHCGTTSNSLLYNEYSESSSLY